MGFKILAYDCEFGFKFVDFNVKDAITLNVFSFNFKGTVIVSCCSLVVNTYFTIIFT